MKISFTSALSVFLFSAADASKKSTFTPHRLQYDDLVKNNSRLSLLDALEDSSGIVSLTNLPENFSSIKKEVMSHLHSCLLEQQEQQVGDISPSVAEESFPDGTVRRTLATATTSEEGPRRVKLDGTGSATSSSTSCVSFEKNLDHFRSIANKATVTFAEALSREMEPHLAKPLLNKRGDSMSSYDTIMDLVANGEQLEHFHSYQKIKNIGEEYDDDDETKMVTIDLHADQGFFIAFTPGMMVSNGGNDDAAATASTGFYIVEEGADAIPIHVDFDVDTDDLVFMLGDGVNQYINNRFKDDNDNGQRHLRATPHTVSLKHHDESMARVWYGRMVLPPNDALVATETGTMQTTLTHGDIRRRLVETPDAYVPAGLGCSSPTMRALQHSLHDEPSMCDKGTLFCWARCMELSDYDITEEMCEEQSLGLKCINPRGQFQTGERHGDFWPACTNTTVELTPYPEIPQADLNLCTSDAFETFLSDTDGVTYDHSFNLTTEKSNATVLQWSVVDEEKGIIRGRLVFGDIFGWLSIGFTDPDGKHNGMNGADIILALPGENYTAKYGLMVPGLTVTPNSDEITAIAKKKSTGLIESKKNPEASSVDEYQIDPNGSSFRHWSEPSVTNKNHDVIVSDCFTAMTFETDNINGHIFNVSGIDDLIWGGNTKDYHVGYHGRGNRARFYVNWKTGEGHFWTDDEEDDVDDHDEDSSGPIVGSFMTLTIVVIVTTFSALI